MAELDLRVARYAVMSHRYLDTDPQEPTMPIVESLMRELVARYGEEKGKRVYHAMEAEGKGPFGPGGKYRKLHEDYVKKIGGPRTLGKRRAPTKKAGARKRRG